MSAARAAMVPLSWARTLRDGQVIDVCSACRVREKVPGTLDREAGCSCEGGELFDVLGHDRFGHRLANTLLRAGVDSVERLSSLSAQQLRDLEGIGAASARRALSCLRSEPGG
ncbi:helix-hairpin-helix domain-containing protein [Streptomyces botrytidirepellens]|uniref:helix-hairpin-helix domain-containing protein n=1 Tax=Streptomyces botrytidirepellens TaxID=2486417 RepID=UPI00161E201D|nr:helix-hairpin-helix domain-containing protein [Streptomyces botrytidirepellens]